MIKPRLTITNWRVIIMAVLLAIGLFYLGMALRKTSLIYFTPGFVCVALIWYGDPGGAPQATTTIVYHFANAIVASGVSLTFAILLRARKSVETARLPYCPICGYCVPYPTKPDCPKCGQSGAFASHLGDDDPRPKCARCGFDLSGSESGACPECGENYY